MTAASFLPGFWLALILDFLFGDPPRMPHPVTMIAGLAGKLESFFKRTISSSQKAGFLTVVLTLAGTGTTVILLLAGLWAISQATLFIGSVVLLYTTIALRSLCQHALAVYHAIPEKEGDGTTLDSARWCVGRIVGRDTTLLDLEGIIRACVESVAENMSDGVVAPLFYAFSGALFCALIGLGQLALPVAALTATLYKAINTMDSMFGYKNEQYLEFGRFAARLDDLANYIPARISGLSLVIVAYLADILFQTPSRSVSVWKILCRDHGNHSSPNGGWPEAAMAGALGFQLGGPGRYFGEIIQKPFLGDAIVQPAGRHIVYAVWLMVGGSMVCCFIFSIGYFFCV